MPLTLFSIEGLVAVGHLRTAELKRLLSSAADSAVKNWANNHRSLEDFTGQVKLLSLNNVYSSLFEMPNDI